MPTDLSEAVDALRYAGLRDIARSHMATQGDGNHFLYVGTLESTGQTVLVTHHGSRGFGARLYKAGMRIAERYRRTLSPETPKANAWIPADTDDGRAYWSALQVVRAWTRENHESIHQAVVEHARGTVAHRCWNEHNFVFLAETAEIDARFHCGRIDVSELPSAYKNAASVQRDMARFDLAEVVDRVLPHGSIMAGNWEHDAPWRKKRRKCA